MMAPGMAPGLWGSTVNQVRIQEIADVRTGYAYSRKQAGEAGGGDLLGLQINDVRFASVVDPTRLFPVYWEQVRKPPVLEPGEVVLAAKGNHNRAAIFLDHDQQVIPSTHFLILTVKDERHISPNFLCWVLNYRSTQNRLADIQTGTNIPSISKKALAMLEVPLPPIDIQERILRLHSLWEEERHLAEAMISNRETMLYGVFQKMLKGEDK